MTGRPMPARISSIPEKSGVCSSRKFRGAGRQKRGRTRRLCAVVLRNRSRSFVHRRWRAKNPRKGIRLSRDSIRLSKCRRRRAVPRHRDSRRMARRVSGRRVRGIAGGWSEWGWPPRECSCPALRWISFSARGCGAVTSRFLHRGRLWLPFPGLPIRRSRKLTRVSPQAFGPMIGRDSRKCPSGGFTSRGRLLISRARRSKERWLSSV